jgi:DNA (cytosine-5)-methyltransferase 1
VRYLSVCSGVEAATVAWHPLGWEPVAFSEIEKFPSEVLKHHYPDVPNLGDMTKYKEWDFGTTGLDLLVGGTPCQSFSVAGLRKGIEDPRGNLALVYCGILDKFRPKWFVWENVPGVLSSGKGRDFGSLLGAMAELGYSCAYRVLDAQYFGVPQRRKRVFIVGYLGDWRNPAKVLFESDSLLRDTKTSRSKGKETAKCLTTRIRNDYETESFVYETHPADSRVKEMGDVCQTVTSRWGTGGGNVPLVQAIPIHSQATQYKGGGKNRNDDGKGNGLGVGKDGDPMNTLTTANVHAIAHAWKMRYGKEGGGKGYLGSDELAFTLSVQQDQQVFSNMAVRRLTPVECERLQGFPDNYTNIKENCPDGPRYKAMGNSMAVPVMRWIGEKIKMVEESQ